jgi:acetyl-CoA carboxylase carboxyltransferase component
MPIEPLSVEALRVDPPQVSDKLDAIPRGRVSAHPLVPQDRLRHVDTVKECIRRGNDERTTRQHDLGKLTVGERIEHLVDVGTFVEVQPFRAPAGTMRSEQYNECEVVCGLAEIHDQQVALYATDFRVRGGSLGSVGASKITHLLDLAKNLRVPVIALHDGAGARIQDGVSALNGYGEIFRRISGLSGVVPQISVILGPCAGGAVYSPALTDFVFMVRGIGSMYVTGPDVVRTVTGEDVTSEQLGGATVHSRHSGVVSNAYADEQECLDDVRFLLSLLPPNNQVSPPAYAGHDPSDRRSLRLRQLVPSASAASYDVADVITELIDNGEFFEISAEYARNLVCGFGRLDGTTVGFVANQPMHLAGALDGAASEKAARFVRFCDAFGISLVTLVDVPGFLPGRDQEASGLIRRGAKLLYAYCEATVPRVSVILRKAYGGAYIVMDSRAVGADVTLAWPTNEIAVMGPQGAAKILHRRQLDRSADSRAVLDVLVEQYVAEHLHPLQAAERGFIDDVIDPADTRRILIGYLRTLRAKHSALVDRKHSTMPL